MSAIANVASAARGWPLVPFDEVAIAQSDRGQRLKQRDYLADGAIPVIDQGQALVGGYTNDEGAAFVGDLPVVLFGDHTRAVKLIHHRFAVGADGIKIFKPAEGVRAKFLYYWMKSAPIPDRGYGRHYQYLRALSVSLPPAEQQDAIVAELEKQFSRLDEAVANLQRVKVNLKRYKTSVLKDAVKGRLVPTEAELARREGRSFETGERLLQRILEARRISWAGRGKFKTPVAPEATGLANLPSGWVWTSVEQIADVISGLTKNPTRETLPLKLPYLRVANVYANELRLDDMAEIGVADNELQKLLVLKNDLLVVEGNGSPDQIGRVAKWDGSIAPCVHQNHLIKVRAVVAEPDWVLNWLVSPGGRKQIELVSSSTTGLHTLSSGKVGRLPVPLPPVAEQQRIASEVDRRLSLIRGVEAEVDANLKRSQALRQSTLSKAFSLQK